MRHSLDEAVAPGRGLWVRDVVNMVAQGDEKVEEELAAAIEHLELHRTALLEGRTATDDERKIVGTQFGVGVGRVYISVACRGQDGAALDATL